MCYRRREKKYVIVEIINTFLLIHLPLLMQHAKLVVRGTGAVTGALTSMALPLLRRTETSSLSYITTFDFTIFLFFSLFCAQYYIQAREYVYIS